MTPERRLIDIADMRVGLTATHEARVDQQTVAEYARAVGDHNPVHEDPDYAARTRFGAPIAHGLLAAGYVQTALTSMVAPGGVSASYEFVLRAPVPVGSSVTARATCSEIDVARRRATFRLSVTVAETGVEAITGQAVIAFPREEAS
jgi:3-hydroxybutyryl-CoA dehydratase